MSTRSNIGHDHHPILSNRTNAIEAEKVHRKKVRYNRSTRASSLRSPRLTEFPG